jgi:MATE family multidrug resistance protein
MPAGRSTLVTLLSLAWPMILARSSQAVIGLSDALMTAPLGKEALAAVTTGAVNIFTAVILPMGLVFIVQSFAAQLTGRGQTGAARRYGHYGLILAAAAGVVAALAVPFVPALIGALDYEPEVAGPMADYMAIRLLAIAPIVGVEALGNWFGGLGKTRVHMVAGLLTMVVNIFLNYLLIEGNLGAPARGVEGAALASALASVVGLVYLMWRFAREPRLAPTGRLRLSELKRVLRFGLPNGVSWFFEFAAFAVYINVVIAHLGTNVLAAMMVVFAVNGVSFMPAFGVASSGAILAGQAIGAGERERVTAILWMTMRVAALWQCSVGLAYLLFPEAIMSLFAPPGVEVDTELISVGATMLALSAGWQLFDSAAITLSETLRSAGDTAWPLWARIVLAWVVFTPLSILIVMGLDGGHVAAILCIIAYIAVLAAVLAWRFLGGAWKKIDLTGEEELLG